LPELTGGRVETEELFLARAGGQSRNHHAAVIIDAQSDNRTGLAVDDKSVARGELRLDIRGESEVAGKCGVQREHERVPQQKA